MNKILSFIYAAILFVLPQLLWITLALQPGFKWDAIKVGIIAYVALAGILGGCIIVYQLGADSAEQLQTKYDPLHPASTDTL